MNTSAFIQRLLTAAAAAMICGSALGQQPAEEPFWARGMREGDKGTVFASSLFVAGKIDAVVDRVGKREVKMISEKIFLPNGIEFHKGSPYVATSKDITSYDNIEDDLDKQPSGASR